jgi:hypothetical protein
LSLSLLFAAAVACFVAGDARADTNLLVNSGFEENRGVGSVPVGWRAIDENFDFFGWVAPRCERSIGGIGPRSGRYMIGLDTELMGVDTNDQQSDVARAAIYQTITVPPGTRGTFSIYINDLGSTALGHVSAIRLAYTVNNTEIGTIKVAGKTDSADDRAAKSAPNTWSKPFYRVSQRLADAPDALGDWTLASIPVEVAAGDKPVQLTLWIGIFDNQNSTEIGYWRIDDASFVVERPAATTRPAK